MMVILLINITQSTTANGQITNGKSHSASHKVTLGRLWVNVAKWQWQIKKKGEPIPSFDSSSVNKFRLSVVNGNPAGLYSLYNTVQAKLPKNSYYDVSNEEFIQALGFVLRKKAEFSSDEINNIISKLKELDASKLEELTNATNKAINQSNLTKSNTSLDSPTDAASSEAHKSQEHYASNLEALELAKEENDKLKEENDKLILHRKALAIIASLTIMALIGSVIWFNRRTSNFGLMQDIAGTTHTKQSATQEGGSSFATAKLEKDLSNEQQRYNQLLAEFNNLKARYERTGTNSDLGIAKPMPNTINTTIDSLSVVPAQTNTPLLSEPFVVPSITSTTKSSPSVVPAQPNTLLLTIKFADKPENRYLTRLYPDSEAYRPLLIRFSSDPSVSEADFEFNPAADQFFFTHNGVDQLMGTFNYSPPDWLKTLKQSARLNVDDCAVMKLDG
jgi:hypothetical protein